MAFSTAALRSPRKQSFNLRPLCNLVTANGHRCTNAASHIEDGINLCGIHKRFMDMNGNCSYCWERMNSSNRTELLCGHFIHTKCLQVSREAIAIFVGIPVSSHNLCTSLYTSLYLYHPDPLLIHPSMTPAVERQQHLWPLSSSHVPHAV